MKIRLVMGRHCARNPDIVNLTNLKQSDMNLFTRMGKKLCVCGRAVILCCCLLIGLSSAAQIRLSVKGRVLDESGMPLPGVSIIEEGTSNGVTTNSKGDFLIRVSNREATLAFSFLGYETVREKVGQRTRIDVQLFASSTRMDEVVVIGYGTAKRSDLTGSVASVSKEAFNDKMITSMEDALRGQIAGVRVLSNDGAPGEDLNIRIRGSGSLNASNAPIYVIDGIMMETASINPGDIESMEILKDASATAIYGAKGANGVVIITTKRGKSGRPQVNFSFSTSIQQPVRLLDMMDSYEFAKMLGWGAFSYYKYEDPNKNFGSSAFRVLKDREGNYWVWNTTSKWADAEKYRDPSSPDYVNTDWQKAMMRNTVVQDYRISLSGGDRNNSYAVMGGYFNQPGIVRHSDFERYSMRFNYERALNNRGSKFGFNLNGLRSTQNGVATGNAGVTMNMLSQAPTKELSSEDWEAEGNEDPYINNNPLYQAERIKRQLIRTNVTARAYFEAALTKDIKLKIAGNLDFNERRNEEYYPKDVASGRNVKGKAVVNNASTFGWNSENLLTYAPKAWGRHRFDIMGGVILEESMRKSLNNEVQNFLLEGLNTESLQDGLLPLSPVTNNVRTRMASFLGRTNYSYDNRYLFTATIRYDGVSCFGDDNKWGLFPSGAFAWRISNEKWMKHVKAVSDLKLRLSVGATGNAAIPDLQTLDLMSRVLYPEDGSNPSYGIGTDRPQNPNLKWESSIQSDAAIDFGLFNNRLSGTVELYYKLTEDLLFEQPQMSHLGYNTSWSNIASIANKGLEVTLNGVILSTRKVNWRASMNMAFNRSKVRSLGGAPEMILNPGSASECTNFGILRVGKPLGNWYGYLTDGVWKSQSEIDALPEGYMSLVTTRDNMRPGDTKYVDTNGDGTINELDRVILGNSQPKFTGGFTNVLRLYGFTLTVGLEYSVGGKIFNATARTLTQLNSNGGRNQLSSAGNFWWPTLYDAETGEVVISGNEDATLRMPKMSWEQYCTDRFLEDASYLRIDNISLKYDLPQKVVRSLKMSQISLFFSVRNAYVFTRYTGYDPDVSVGSGIYADLLPKLDAGSYPRTRSFTVGASLTF